MQCSNLNFADFSIAQLEVFAIARGQVIETIQREMVEIQKAIVVKQDYYMQVERFAGMSPEAIDAFKALHQGVVFSGAQQYGA